jgi:hypothetical protein
MTSLGINTCNLPASSRLPQPTTALCTSPHVVTALILFGMSDKYFYQFQYNIKMDLLEIGLNVVYWTGLAQDRYRWRALVNSVMNLRVP